MARERAQMKWTDTPPSDQHEEMANKTLLKVYNKDTVAKWQKKT